MIRHFYRTENSEHHIVWNAGICLSIILISIAYHCRSFHILLERISQHPVFLSAGRRPQRPPIFQLQVALFYLGGGHDSRVRTSIHFQIAEGTVENYVRRVTVAILSLQGEFLSQWPAPDSENYKAIVQRHQLQYGFPNVLGFVDGTIIPAYRKPIDQGESYYTRKSCYAIHTTLVVDSTTRILFVYAGRIVYYLYSL